MKKSKRFPVAGIVLEVALACLMIFLWLQLPGAHLAQGVSADDAARTIGSTIGTLMGVIGVVVAITYVALRRAETR